MSWFEHPARLFGFAELLEAPRRFGVALACLASLACAEDHIDEIARGRELFHSPSFSPASSNVYACVTCHDLRPDGASPWVKPGAPLAGVTLRPSYWNGQVAELAAAVDQCRQHFMAAREPMDPEDPDARALYALLASTEPGLSDPVAFTVPREIAALPRGDSANGLQIYTAACSYCHGSLHTGAGRSSQDTSILPEDTITDHPGYTQRTLRLVITEKVRHGRFYGYGGRMPPFSIEVLSDPMLSDLLEALGIYAE